MSISRRPYPTYRDSDVPWLGEIPTHWEVRRIRQIGRLGAGAGFPHRKQGVQDAELPFYKVSDMNLHGNDVFMSLSQHSVSRETARELGAEAFSAGSIIFPKVGAALLTNKRRILTMQSCVDNNIMVLTPEAGNNKYVYYQLLGLDLGRLANPGAVPSINETQAKEIDLIFPPVHEQRVIATFLDRETAKIDTLIRKQERLIELLGEKRAALITHAVTKGLDPDVSMRDSAIPWLGEIPAHWDVMDLKYALERNDGGVWGDEPDHDGTIVLRSTDMAVGGKWTIDEPALRKLSPAECKGARLRTGDLLVTKSSGSALHLGKTALVTPEVEALRCCFSNFMQRLRPTSRFSSRYLYRVLNSPLGREQFNFLGSTTTGLNNLSQNVIDSVRVPVPGLEEQRAIATFVDRETARIDGLVGKAHRMIERLQEYRTALISAAVTGKIDVREEI